MKQFTIKSDKDGKWLACTKDFIKGKRLLQITRQSKYAVLPSGRRDYDHVVGEYTDSAYYVYDHVHDCKIITKDRKMIVTEEPKTLYCYHLDDDGNRPLGVPYDVAWMVEKELPDDVLFMEGEVLTEDELELRLRKYPTIVYQMAEVLMGQGETWKDECGETHVDDVNPYGAMNKVYELLKAGRLDFVTNQLLLNEDSKARVGVAEEQG